MQNRRIDTKFKYWFVTKVMDLHHFISEQMDMSSFRWSNDSTNELLMDEQRQCFDIRSECHVKVSFLGGNTC